MKCVNLAVNAVVTGEADVLMKGLVSTDKYMRGILNKDAGLFPPKGTLSHVAVVEMPNYPKLLVISDVAVIPQPDFKQKTILIGYLTRIANLIGIKTPKIACIAPSEQLLPSVLSSTEAALLAKMGDRGQLGNVVIDGPLTRKPPRSRRSRVPPSQVMRTVCSSPTSNRATSSSRLPRTWAAVRSRRWSWEPKFPAC